MSELEQAEPLLTCLRFAPGEEKLSQLRALTAADWEAAIDQARLRGLMPVLYWEVKNLEGQISLAEAGWQELRGSFIHSAGKSLLLYRELASILELLGKAGIPVILLKGLHLAKFVYPEPALRPMADIDLLLHPSDLTRASQILLSLGYGSTRVYELERELHKHQHIPPLYQPGKAPVELHWQIATPGSPLRVDLDGLWSRARPVEVGSAPALVLSPEDLLLHLSLHLLQDEFIGGLKRLYDILALSSFYGEKLDWAQAQQRSDDWGCRKSLFLVLHLAHALLHAPVPDEILEQLRPPDFTPEIEALARQRILTVRQAAPELHPDLARLRRNRPWRAKAAGLVETLFPYPEYVAAKYALPPGSKKVYWYYLVRLKDLAGRYGWQLWRVARGEEMAEALAQRENALSDWWMRG